MGQGSGSDASDGEASGWGSDLDQACPNPDVMGFVRFFLDNSKVGCGRARISQRFGSPKGGTHGSEPSTQWSKGQGPGLDGEPPDGPAGLVDSKVKSGGEWAAGATEPPLSRLVLYSPRPNTPKPDLVVTTPLWLVHGGLGRRVVEKVGGRKRRMTVTLTYTRLGPLQGLRLTESWPSEASRWSELGTSGLEVTDVVLSDLPAALRGVPDP